MGMGIGMGMGMRGVNGDDAIDLVMYGVAQRRRCSVDRCGFFHCIDALGKCKRQVCNGVSHNRTKNLPHNSHVALFASAPGQIFNSGQCIGLGTKNANSFTAQQSCDIGPRGAARSYRHPPRARQKPPTYPL